jgi:chromosome segregation ATPase
LKGGGRADMVDRIFEHWRLLADALTWVGAILASLWATRKGVKREQRRLKADVDETRQLLTRESRDLLELRAKEIAENKAAIASLSAQVEGLQVLYRNALQALEQTQIENMALRRRVADQEETIRQLERRIAGLERPRT